MKTILGIYKVGGGVISSPETLQKFIDHSVNMWPKSEKGDQVTRIFVISAFGHLTNLLQSVIDTMPDNAGESIKNLVSFANQMELGDFDIPIRFSKDLMRVYFLHTGEYLSSRKIKELMSDKDDETYIFSSARNFIRTETGNIFESPIDLDLTQKSFDILVKFFSAKNLPCFTYITQGFIATDADHKPTLLGREGSDYTAAILAHCAKKSGMFDEVNLTFLKSTPGVCLNWREEGEQDDFEKELSWDTLSTMADWGSKIFFPKVASLLKDSKIAATVTNLDYFSTDDPTGKGKTVIS